MSGPRFNRWWTVASGAVGAAFGIGTFLVYVLGGLTKPMVADLHFDRSVISFSMTCFLIATGAGTVSLGMLIHRFGVCRPAFAYLAATALLVALIPSLPAKPAAFYLLFSLLGVAGAASTVLPYSVAITGLFDRNRGLALALAVSGGAGFAIFGPLLGQALLERIGWRDTLHVMAALIALPLIPLAVFVRTPPSVAGEPASAPRRIMPAFMSAAAFWRIAAAVLGIAAGGFVLASLVPLLTDGGLSPRIAAQVVSVAGMASLVGRLGLGVLLDRFWAPAMAACVCAAAGVGVFLLANCAGTIGLAYAGAALIGFGLGAEGDLLTYLCGRYFDRREFSRVVGAMWVVWAWGGGVATTAAGVAYKTTGTYRPALLLLCGVLLIAALVVLTLGRYIYPPRHADRMDGATAEIPS